jgi:Leucine-rich repeat (LRR) protein
VSIKLANKRVNDFKDKYGDRALELACHAALPVAFNIELLHLLRINFFVDTSADRSDDTEFQLLLSPLCREIDEGLYEIEPEIRDILLETLQPIENGERVKDVASLLKQYIDRDNPWKDRVELQRAQQLTALNILDRAKSREWLGKLNKSEIDPEDLDWYVAMYKDIDRQNEIADFANIEEDLKSSSTYLDLSKRGLFSIPPKIMKRTDLESLDLSGNNIVEIPEAIGKLTNLTRLDLDRNQITSVPEAIGKLTNLTTLYLYKNQIDSLPEAIGKLTNLTGLGISNNQITIVPEAIGNLTNLTELYLDNNQIAILPKAIGNLTNLIHLSLDANHIAIRPEWIDKLTNLTKLSISNLQSTNPEWIANLTNLTHLWLDDNKIVTIPEWIANLTNLTHLSLTDNQITEIPQWLRSLKQLEKLDLRNNSLPIPPEIYGSTDIDEDPPVDAKVILDFYFNSLAPAQSMETDN